MINKYFGDKVKAVDYKGWKGKSYNQMINKFREIDQEHLNKRIQVLMGTRLTDGGYVVVLNGRTGEGIYIIDSYGDPRPGSRAVYKTFFGFQTQTIDHYEYFVNYQRNTTTMNYTYGDNIFIPWDNVRAQSVGKLWYMTIEAK